MFAFILLLKRFINWKHFLSDIMNLLYIVPEEHAVMGLMVSHPSTSKLYGGPVCFLSHSNYVIVL